MWCSISSLKKHRKLKKHLMLQSFLSIFWNLETSLKNLGKASNIQQMFYSMHFFFREKLEIISFYFQSQKFTRKLKKCFFFVIFVHFWGPWNFLENIEKQSNFQQLLYSLYIFFREKFEIVYIIFSVQKMYQKLVVNLKMISFHFWECLSYLGKS